MSGGRWAPSGWPASGPTEASWPSTRTRSSSHTPTPTARPGHAAAPSPPSPPPSRAAWAGERDRAEAFVSLLEEMVEDPASGVDDIACIVVEPIQGNGGVVIPPAGFLAGLRRVADRSGAVLIFDEIQSGLGRSGRMWACDHEGVVPDLMTVGKGIGGGLTLAAVVGRDDLMTTWKPDATTSTFLANALNLAAGVAALDLVREQQLDARPAPLREDALAQRRAGPQGARGLGDRRRRR